jgi:hypothetical protein
MNFFIIGSVLFLFRDSEKYVQYLLSGLFIGAALLFKSTILLFVILIIISLLYFKKNENGLRKSIMYVSGIAIMFLFCLAYYFLNDALRYFLEVQLVQIPMYAKIGYLNESREFILGNIFRMFTYSVYAPLILFSILLIVFSKRKKEFSFKSAILLSWLAAALLSIIIQWKFFYYHFILLIPPLTIIIFSYYGYFSGLFNKVSKRTSLTAALIAIIFYVIFAGRPYVSKYSDLSDVLSHKNTFQEKYIKLGITQDSVFTIKKINEVTEYIQKNTNENEKIFVWGIEPLIYYLSGRDCVSRFIYNTPLYWRGNNLSYQNEFIKSLKENNPVLILIAVRDPMEYITGYSATSEEMLNQSPEFKDIILNNYVKENEIGEFKIYRLKTKYL